MSDIPASQQVKVKGIVDIVFLMDATGSMQPTIDDLKNNLKHFIDELTGGAHNQNPVEHWRGKVIGYRDFLYDSVPIEDNPFVETSDELRAQLDKLKAEGGGDEPESLLEGIYHVANMEQTDRGLSRTDLDPNKWRYRSDGARVVIVFTDADYHETMEKPKGGTIDDVATKCMEQRIILRVYAPDMDLFDEIGEIDKASVRRFSYDKNDEEGAVKALRDFTGDKENFRETMLALAKTVSQSAQTEVI
jgi:hypothetical protein